MICSRVRDGCCFIGTLCIERNGVHRQPQPVVRAWGAHCIWSVSGQSYMPSSRVRRRAVSIRLSTAVDVLISAASPVASKDEVTTALLKHTKLSPSRAAELASRILAGQKVCFEFHSDEAALTFAEALRGLGMTVRVQK